MWIRIRCSRRASGVLFDAADRGHPRHLNLTGKQVVDVGEELLHLVGRDKAAHNELGLDTLRCDRHNARVVVCN